MSAVPLIGPRYRLGVLIIVDAARAAEPATLRQRAELLGRRILLS